MKRKETKAERIFRNTYTACRVFVKEHPEMTEVYGFNSLECEATECIYQRTMNEIRNMYDTEVRLLETAKKLGLDFDFETKEKALRMLELTINHQYIVK